MSSPSLALTSAADLTRCLHSYAFIDLASRNQALRLIELSPTVTELPNLAFQLAKSGSAKLLPPPPGPRAPGRSTHHLGPLPPPEERTAVYIGRLDSRTTGKSLTVAVESALRLRSGDVQARVPLHPDGTSKG